MNATYRTIIEPDAKGFHGFVPALRGCHTWGKTVGETQKNLQEAVELYVEALSLQGKEIPIDNSFESFATVQVRPKLKRSVRTRRVYA
jgi:predicted RNase H-like HicB family nuclease